MSSVICKSAFFQSENVVSYICHYIHPISTVNVTILPLALLDFTNSKHNTGILIAVSTHLLVDTEYKSNDYILIRKKIKQTIN